MPTYTCDKCARVFKQKSGFDDHKARKNDCANNTVLNSVIATKVDEKVKEVIRATQQKPEITKETLPAFFEDLHNLLWNRAGLDSPDALKHMIFFFAFRLIEQQADTLNLPQECRWSFIASLKNENDLFETIKKGVALFRSKPKTKQFFEPHKIQKAEIVYEVVQQISRISLKTLQDTDTLGDIFEYLLGRGMSTMADEGQYFTNRTICKLAFKLAYDIKKNLRRADGSLCTFADWFCGTGGFPAEYIKGVKANLPEVDWKKDFGAVYCQDMSINSITTTLLNLLLVSGVSFSGGDKIRGSNSFSDPITTGTGAPFAGLTVDYCFMNPPYGGDKGKGKDYKFAYSKKVKGEDGTTSKKFFVNQEIQSIGIEDDDKVSAGVQLAMATLSADGGICSIVLLQGFFFGNSKKCVELRKKIAEEYKIWYVVDIASGSFLNTGTKTSMMVFQKGVGPTDKVAFIGLDEKPLVEATLAELQSKHYSLNYKQYLPQSAVEVEGFEMVKLGDIAEIRYGTRITQAKDAGTLYPAYGGGGLMTYMTDKFNREGITYKVSRDGMSPHNCVMKIIGKYFCNDTAITVHTKDTTRALDGYIGEWLLLQKTKIYNDCSRGTAQLHIDLDTFLSLQIPLPSIERQKQIVEAIDGWASLAQQEEVALKILEKQMMFQVKEMGRGQARVKLGSLIVVNYGERITKKESQGDLYPVFGSGGDTFRYEKKNREGVTCKVGRFAISEHNCVQIMFADYWCLDSALTITSKDSNLMDCYLWYWLLNNKYLVYECSRGTAQQHIDMDSFRNFEIPLPPLTEQQTLQSDFDEIRHKHAKIAVYKAKAQEAIQRLIPGASA
jgi:type I restriction-modification system DNA methylase subunit